LEEFSYLCGRKNDYKMTRRIYTLAILFQLATMVAAAPVTQAEARRKAASFLSARSYASQARTSVRSQTSQAYTSIRSQASQTRASAPLRLVATGHYRTAASDAPCYYIYNVGSGAGFVIVGADDLMPDVLGYSTDGSFDAAAIPDNMRAWLDEYSRQMAWLCLHPEAAVRQTVSGNPVAPLLAAQWSQRSPYNDLCPLDGSRRSATGCVATAMGQVMHYYQWPRGTVAEIPAYTSASRQFNLQSIPAATAIDWQNILPAYDADATQAQQQAVAQLVQMCGSSVQMDYTASNSLAVTSTASAALKRYFDYDASTTFVSRNCYRQAEWNQMIYDELAAGRPVIYAGKSTGGSHAFIVDGYDGDDYFHVNWGWGGTNNDYFLLSILDPYHETGILATSSLDGYGFSQEAIIGIRPNTGAEDTTPMRLTTTRLTLTSGDAYTRDPVYGYFFFDAAFDVWNYTDATHAFDFGNMGAFDADGNLIMLLGGTNSIEMPSCAGYRSLSRQFAIAPELTDGTYYLKPVSREEGTPTWYANAGTDIACITAVIDGNTLRLSGPVVDLSATITPSGDTEAMKPVPLDVAVTNNGTPFNGELFLLIDDRLAGGRHLDLDAGATATLTFSFVPLSEGIRRVSLCLQASDKSYTPIAATTVTVAEASAILPLTTSPGDGFDVYSPSGLLLRRRAASLSDLPPGLYIINGRKVVNP